MLNYKIICEVDHCSDNPSPLAAAVHRLGFTSNIENENRKEEWGGEEIEEFKAHRYLRLKRNLSRTRIMESRDTQWVLPT